MTIRSTPIRTRHPLRPLAVGLAAALGLAAATDAGATEAPDACHVGAYGLADGQVVDIGLSEGGLRWRRLDGESGKLTRAAGVWRSTLGWTGRPDGRRIAFGTCAEGSLRFDGIAGRRIALPTLETTFVRDGLRLAGRLVMPPGDGEVPIVVLLHGSEDSSARDFDPLQRLLPAGGVGVFVYDKRGTGASQGAYTQDFSVLADDAAAALAEARRLAGRRGGRIGFQGPSQGGWVAPLAARRAPVDFVIVSFGLAISVLEEDAEAMAFQMRLKGHDESSIAKAQQLSRAAGAVFESGFTMGIEAFEAVRARYRHEPWYGDVHGNFTHVFLGLTEAQLREAGPKYRWGTPFRYDPMPTLEALATPQLWVLGGLDIDAPAGETSRRLGKLIAAGRPVTLAVYPKAEHGMTEFETAADGARLSTRYAEGYFRMMADFAREGCLRHPYGDARISHPTARGCPPRRPAAP